MHMTDSLKFTNPKESYRILQPNAPEEWEAYYRLRYEILRKPWNQKENTTKDEWEDQSLHFLVMDDLNEPIATGRLQINSSTEGQIRSMAVREEYRNKGIGNLLIKTLEAECAKRGITTIVLDAREPALDFYKKNAYVVVADSYLLFGTIKHFRMTKQINNSPGSF